MKKIFILLAVLVFAVTLTGCFNDDNQDDKSYVSLGINPQIDIMVDANNKVISVYAENDDAKVLLYEEDLVGMNFDDALAKITNLSIEYGYITEDNDTIDFMISSTLDDKYQADLKASIENVMVETGENGGINLTLKAEGSFTLTRELEQLKAENPDNKLIQALTIEKFKLVTSATASDDTLTFEAALELDDQALMDKINASRDEFYNLATAHYDALAVQSQIAYDKVLNAFLRNIYATYYMKDLNTMMNHPVNYGALYNIYGMTADTLNGVYRLIKVVSDYRYEALDEEAIENVILHIQALGIEEAKIRQEIKDDNGNVTIDSVNHYLDKVVKNLVLNEYQSEIETLKSTLNELDTTIKEQVNVFKDTYKAQIDTAMALVETTLAALEASLALILGMQTYITEFKTMITSFTEDLNGDFNVDTLGEWVNKFQAKEQEMLDKIKTDLSAEELQEIEKLQQTLSTEVNNAKNTFEQEMRNAVNTVKNELKALKDARKN